MAASIEVNIEFQDTTGLASEVSGGESRVADGEAKDLPSNVKLGDLLPKSVKAFGEGKAREIGHPNYDKYSESGAFGVMNAMGVEEYTPMIPFFEALWSRIDGLLEYPDDFAKQRITGTVVVHVPIDYKGRFRGEFLEIIGVNDILNTYVAAFLVTALKNPLHESRWLPEGEDIPVILTFEFSIIGNPEQVRDDRGFHAKNMLLFHRTEFVDSRLNEFLAEYIPPIIPLPGGFFINFVSAYNYLKNLNEPSERERRRERIIRLKEGLEFTLRKDR